MHVSTRSCTLGNASSRSSISRRAACRIRLWACVCSRVMSQALCRRRSSISVSDGSQVWLMSQRSGTVNVWRWSSSSRTLERRFVQVALEVR